VARWLPAGLFSRLAPCPPGLGSFLGSFPCSFPCGFLGCFFLGALDGHYFFFRAPDDGDANIFMKASRKLSSAGDFARRDLVANLRDVLRAGFRFGAAFTVRRFRAFAITALPSMH
jgi:hypothetical protein